MSNPTELPDLDRQFRKKPVVIEAIQWTGKLECLDAFNIPELHQSLGSDKVGIPTLEGTMIASVGDWIIKGVKGEFYPCKPDIFAATYEPVARRAQPEGEAPQAEAYDRFVALRKILKTPGYCDGTKYSERQAFSMAVESINWKEQQEARGRNAINKLFADQPAAQHAESGAPAALDEAAIVQLFQRVQGRYSTFGGPLNAIVKFAREVECAALAAQSQGAQAAELCIGFANNDQGVLVNVMQRHADGTTIVLHHGRVPAGDSFARFALAAKAEAPAPRTDLSKRIRAAATADVTMTQAKLLIGAAEEIERAQQAAAPGSTIDTLEFQMLMGDILDAQTESEVAGCSDPYDRARAKLVDYINSKLTTSAPGTPEAPKKPAHGHRDDYFLMANARRIAARRFSTTPNWAFAAELFATGSNSAHEICRNAGIDPDSYKVERAAQLDGGQEGSAA